MKIYRVAFAGHREIPYSREIEDKLYTIICDLIRKNEFTEFYVGSEGDFDIISTSLIRRARKALGEDKSALNLVIPYPKANMDCLDEAFDAVILPEQLYKFHPKAAISERNKIMVKMCDLLICYVNSKGGASKTRSFALSIGKAVLDLI